MDKSYCMHDGKRNTYRHGISMEQCEWKVKHTEQLIDHDLPVFYYGATFGRHLHPVWLD